jgi:hypothetical protein
MNYINARNVILYEDLLHRPISNNKRRWILFIVLFALIYFLRIITKKQTHLDKTVLQLSHLPEENFLDGCQYIYIDLGTNIGIQIRKLYEPFFYPKAFVLPLFQKIFGNQTKEVCSIGFEANPAHDSYLKEFENYCLKRKWRVKIFTSTAVNIVNKNVSFYTQPANILYNQWASSLRADPNKTEVTVSSIDIASWFKEKVLNRKIPSDLGSSRIMMKIDIEDHDAIVLTHLIFSGVYCSIDLIYGEHFNHEFQNAVSVLKRYSNSCKTELVYMDDELYHNLRIPFLNFKSTN